MKEEIVELLQKKKKLTPYGLGKSHAHPHGT